MRLHFHRDGHDPRQIDLVAVIALLVVVYGGICYLASPSFEPKSTTAQFIEASQSMRW
jgi:hypothetical protein